MSKSQNPLRIVADSTKFGIDGGTSNLVANGIYSVEDIVQPVLTRDATIGDPRIFASEGRRSSRVRTVNRNGWISPKRKAEGDKDTVLQLKFAQPKKFNYLSFELLRVPQTFIVKYYDDTRKKMVVLSDTKGQKVTGVLSGFKVNVTNPNKNENETKKWRQFSYDLPPIRSNLIEIHLNREIDNPPTNLDDFFGLPANTRYSLGARNLRIKMKIRSDEDVDDGDDDDGTPTPIGTTERAAIKRHTSLNAHDGAETSYWQCAPQGAATSVVPLYLDLRQDDGSASVFDMIKLVPIWPGPSMSVYYSSDDTVLPWTLSPNRVNLSIGGDTAPVADPDYGALVEENDSSFLAPNQYIRMEIGKSFCVGMQWRPTFTNSGNDRWLWNWEDGGSGLGLKFDPTASGASTVTGQFKVQQDQSTTLATFSESFTLDIDTTYAFVLGYNASSTDSGFPKGWYLAFAELPATNASIHYQFTTGTDPDVMYPSQFRIGANPALDRPARGYVANIWAKLDRYTDRMAQAYLSNIASFTRGEGETGQRVNGHYNTVFATRLLQNFEARVGPGAGYYRSKEWTPVPVDYSLETTHYTTPITTAKFLKLEFSNLVPRTYISEIEQLPVTDFPQWVKDWYRSINPQRQGVPYKPRTESLNLFEGVTPVPTPGSNQRLPQTRQVLERGSGNGLPSIIYHRDQATADAVTDPAIFDDQTLYKELQLASTPFRFQQTGRHEYETTYVQVERRAFFCGLKELEVFRSAQDVLMDNPQYVETYDDNINITSNVGWISTGNGTYSSQSIGPVLTSKTFESYSNFTTIQAAVVDGGWESVMTREQIDMGTVAHLGDPQGGDFDTSTSTVRTFVTGQFQGARGGNVLQFRRVVGSTDEYGVRMTGNIFVGAVSYSVTGQGVLSPEMDTDGLAVDTGSDSMFEDMPTHYGGTRASLSISGNARTSVVVRMQLPTTNLGTYELRLYARNDAAGGVYLVASRPVVIPIKSWQEVELAYVANSGDYDWRAEIVQTNSSVDEPLVVDMLGIWQNPVQWEFSNDGGITWEVALWTLNNPYGYLRFPDSDYRLRVRATALKSGAVISGWTVVPWYLDSPMVARAAIDLIPPWSASDDETLLDTTHKPIFRTWNHWFPQGYSVNLYGYR